MMTLAQTTRLRMRTSAALVMLALAAMARFAPAAAADAASEAYVASHAAGIVAVLNDSTLSEAERTQKFRLYLQTFAHMPDIARRVLGVRGRTLSDVEFSRYEPVFEEYATAVYKARFDEMRGGSIQVTRSLDISARRSQVTMLVRKPGSTQDMQVVWDVLQSQDGTAYRVRDVGVALGGSTVWLAQDQQSQFEAFLDRNHGDIDKLIDQIKSKTAALANAPRRSAGLDAARRDARAVD